MKEITREVNLRVTTIEKVPDDLADELVLNARNEGHRRAAAALFKQCMGADDVQITGIKDFVRDIEEE